MTDRFEEYQERFQKMEEALKNTKRLIVLTHDNPDPDSVSSAVTLAYIIKNKFKIPTTVKYGGIVGRAENRAMIRVLNLRVSLLSDTDFKPGVDFAVVDMQPNTGNSSFPKNRKPLIVIDHHALRKTTRAEYIDVRTNYGATATVLTEYLVESGLEMTSQLATALSYGISSETQDLGREAGEADIKAYLSLFPKSNKKLLANIVHPRLPRDYYITLNRALHHSLLYRNVIATRLDEVKNPDFVPFIADFMLRCERASWAICLGRYKEKIVLSIRTTNTKGEAGRFLRRLVGKRGTAGGHEMIAGGQIPTAKMEHEEITKLEDEIVQAFLKKLGHSEAADMTPLLTPEPITA
ncbi:MAG: DHH family phosphoesterase [Candidatus Omnitrophica bacterium]|nr:DHH family phosphoesterase [Candidatus Omnitrophota bacterium]